MVGAVAVGRRRRWNQKRPAACSVIIEMMMVVAMLDHTLFDMVVVSMVTPDTHMVVIVVPLDVDVFMMMFGRAIFVVLSRCGDRREAKAGGRGCGE